MGAGFAGGSTAGTGLASLMGCIRGCRPGSVAPAMGGSHIVIINPTGVAVCPVFVLGAVQITVFGGSTAMGTGFGVSALGTGIAAEGVIAPSGISVSVQLASAAITLCVIAVHIGVFIGVNCFCVAVFAVSAGCTFSVAVESMVKPAGVSPALGDSSALGTLGFVAVHIGVFHRVNLRVAVGAGGEHRHRQDGHDHQNGEKRTQNF